MSGSDASTEERLRDALGTLASGVTVSSDAYRGVQAEWRRRERRRRRTAAAVATALILLADGVGLWALNQASDSDQVIFDGGNRTGHSGTGELQQP